VRKQGGAYPGCGVIFIHQIFPLSIYEVGNHDDGHSHTILDFTIVSGRQ